MSFFSFKKKILVVEDEADIAEGLKTRLELEGFRVILAENGKVGVEKARQHRPHLIILDVMMPVLDGFEACQIIRKDEKFKDTPIVMLTALSQVKDADTAFELGANDYLNKPYTNERLVEKVKKWIK